LRLARTLKIDGKTFSSFVHPGEGIPGRTCAPLLPVFVLAFINHIVPERFFNTIFALWSQWTVALAFPLDNLQAL
jgi:hypothetical protein